MSHTIIDGSTGKGNDATTPTGSVGSAAEAIDELAGLSLEEQERQRAEWNTVNRLSIDRFYEGSSDFSK